MAEPLTVAQLRAILTDAPDDAPVSVNFYRGDTREPLRLTVTNGEYLDPEQWRDEAGLMLQAEY